MSDMNCEIRTWDVESSLYYTLIQIFFFENIPIHQCGIT